MKIRTRIMAAAAALAMAMMGAFALAPSANAVLYAIFTPNPDGTVTVHYPTIGDNRVLLFCDPSLTATDLSQCNTGNYEYVLSTMENQLPASPALVYAGMPATSMSDFVDLPAGRYTMVYAVFYDGNPDAVWYGGAQNVPVGVFDTATTPVIPPWVQAFGRFSADTCPAGWSASWQQWAVPVTGGYVCTRQIPSLG